MRELCLVFVIWAAASAPAFADCLTCDPNDAMDGESQGLSAGRFGLGEWSRSGPSDPMRNPSLDYDQPRDGAGRTPDEIYRAEHHDEYGNVR